MATAPSRPFGPERAAVGAFLDLPVAVAVLDRDLRFIAVNEALAALNGLTIEEHLGQAAPSLLPGLDPGAWDVFRRVAETGMPTTFLVRGRTPASEEEGAWQEELHPLRDPATNEVIGVVTTVIDVSVQHRLEQAAVRQRDERHQVREATVRDRGRARRDHAPRCGAGPGARLG